MLPAELLERWRDRASDVTGHLAPADALWLRAVKELEEALFMAESEPLTLEQAQELSGFSKDYLAREIRQGRIPNAGKKRAPRIRRGDVPRKAGHRVTSVALSAVGSASSPAARERRVALALHEGR